MTVARPAPQLSTLNGQLNCAMRCPSCGFENMPGRESCCVCSAALSSGAGTQSVLPPRAKDRSRWERLTWPLTNSPTWAGIRLRVGSTQVRRPTIRWPTIVPGFSLREAGLALLSVIPGLGHIYVCRIPRMGRLLLLGTLAALAAAVLLYRTPLADALVYGIIVLSMFSVWATVDRLWLQRTETLQRSRQRLGIALMVVAAYLGTYTVARIAVSPVLTVVTITGQLRTEAAARGDVLVIRRTEGLRRGDFVVGGSTWAGENTLIAGPIVGLPGDRVELRERVYVNGVPTSILTPAAPNTSYGPVATTLGPGQYWVLPTVFWDQYDAGAFLNAGLIAHSDIWGRAVATIDPPSRRRLMHRTTVIGEH